MTETTETHLSVSLPDRRQAAIFLVILTRFVTALCWLGSFAVLSQITAGALALLLITVGVTAIVFWALHYQRPRPAKAQSGLPHREDGVRRRPVQGSGMGRICAGLGFYVAVLCWVGAGILMNNMGIFLLAVPLLATLAMYAAKNWLKRLHP